jgi:bisphosphoglycerate-dependent phosphoglycerate mutase
MYNLTSADPSSLAKYFTSEISDSGYVEHPKTVTSTYRSNQEVMQVLEEAMKAIYAGSPSEREEMKRIYAEHSGKREDASPTQHGDATIQISRKRCLTLILGGGLVRCMPGT